MERIEQAVFTSAQTERADGYQLAAASGGICQEDARALASWGPSHDALLESAPAASVNFHPLPSGAYCVSRTTASGGEYSGRGARIYTQCLVLEPEAFRRFGNNPFHVVRAASGSGLLRQYSEVPRRLEPLPLVGRAPAVDSAVLARAAREIGAAPTAALIQAALSSKQLAVVGRGAGEVAVAALISCLPPGCRTEFSFSTGLRFCPRRPFRIVALGTDAAEQRRVRRVYDLAVVDLSGDLVRQFPPTDGWPRAILRLLKTGRTSLLGRHFALDRADLGMGDLNALGLELLEELERLADGPCRSAKEPPPAASCGRPAAVNQQAHAAHARFERQAQPRQARDPRLPGSSDGAGSDDPAVVARLEQIDDLVFEAVNGNAQSLSRLQQVWPQVRSELSDAVLRQSREQYLRYALSVWEQRAASGNVRPPAQVLAALEVLCLIFDEDCSH